MKNGSTETIVNTTGLTSSSMVWLSSKQDQDLWTITDKSLFT